MGPGDTGRFTTADASDVATRDDLAGFVGAMLHDFRASGEAEWENGTLERFLDALEAVAGNRLNWEPTEAQEQPSWRRFAEMLLAATGYE